MTTRAGRTALVGLMGFLGCGHEGVPATPSVRPGDDGGALAGGDDGGTPGVVQAGTLPCEVEDFLTTHCQSCHDGRSGKAPFALASRADLTGIASDGTSIAARAVARMADPVSPMPPAGLLPASVTAPLVDWLSAGMPAGTCSRDAGPPFEPIAPVSALSKVKTLLTGEPVGDDELRAYEADRAILPQLIDGYLASPHAEQKLLAFFQTAFQQTELLPNSLADQLGVKRLPGDPKALARLVANVEESFARTALAIVREGRPFTDVLTTTRFELSTALVSLLLTHDVHHVDDQGKLSQPALAFDVLTEGSAIDFEQAIKGASTDLHFSAIGSTGACASTLRSSRDAVDLFAFLLGAVPRSPGCNVALATPIFSDADFSDFRSVEIVPGKAGAGPRFFDLPALRAVTTLPLATPRVGFFTTPAFFANWATNDANQARVTANQTLIVALFASFDGSDPGEPSTRDGLTGEHADASSACYACHKTLDPMRMFFRESFTYAYSSQRDASVSGSAASLDLDGLGVRGQGVADLGRALAAHPRFASAWVRKLCAYANSAPCTADDPEVARVAEVFAAAGYDFRVLVRTLFSSPLVTGSATTQSAESVGFSPSILRKGHLCDALSTRLGLDDACGLALGTLSVRQKQAEVAASTIPADGYSRGAEVPVTLSDTGLFFQGATDNLCAILAASSVDSVAGARYRPAALEAALADMVASVMNLPASDPRASAALDILRGHYRDAVAGGQSPLTALRSTFVLACTAPSSVAIGL